MKRFAKNIIPMVYQEMKEKSSKDSKYQYFLFIESTVYKQFYRKRTNTFGKILL
jgi:hypothetical protein